MAFSWKLEGSRWQVPERIGLVVVLVSIPLFYLDWQYQKAIGEPVERLGVNALAHLIVFLSAVKLLQVKKDRDWVFLYLISFFEVLLAAGLSFSPLFLGTLSLYLLTGISAVTAFEIQKARRAVSVSETRLLVPPDSRVFRKSKKPQWRSSEAFRLPFVSLGLLLLIFVLALPLFLVAPRSGAALLTRSSGGAASFIGFSESVQLGQIGELKQDNAVVMRVRVHDNAPPNLRWRGVALDEFTGTGWKKSQEARRIVSDQKLTDRAFFQFGTADAVHRLTTQTFFLEPNESSVLFAASRPVAIHGDLPFVRIDNEGSLQSRRHEMERLIYKAISDTYQPPEEKLRDDMRQYSPAYYRYLQLPDRLDPRIPRLATTMILNSGALNRYDAAVAIEQQLQRDYGYSLQLKAGGPDPLADFLFNVRTGHCEYFATAMAVLLRTHGIASRVVNGFLPGEYNETAGAFTVKQSDAHSWVEVYFPETGSWVTFDPTPSAGRTSEVSTGVTAQFKKYLEALELVWFQYVVGYDKQEQRSLATSIHAAVFDYGRQISNVLAIVRSYIPKNVLSVLLLLLIILLLASLVFLTRRVWRLGWRRSFINSDAEGRDYSNVAFYERLITLMADRGFRRDTHVTPMEFAGQVGLAEVDVITRAYNRVRYGKQKLTPFELKEINRILTNFESSKNSATDFHG
jgi:protein-glutamine gamma-glutamyltransferase